MLNSTLYIELRDVLDTRLTTIALLDKKLAIRAVRDDNYINRVYEEYDYLSNDILAYFKHVDLSTKLTESFASNVLEVASVEINMLLSKLIETNDSGVVTLEVNTYPYTLSDHMKNQLANAIFISVLSDFVNIEFIYLKPTELTLSYADNKYNVMIMYDGMEWLEYHIGLSDGQANETKLYIPAMLMKPLSVKKEKDIETMLQSVNELYKPYIDVTSIPVQHFHIRKVYIEAFINKNS